MNSASSTKSQPALARAAPLRPALGALTVLLGWLLVLRAYNWHFTASVLFLGLGWSALVITGRLLWTAFWQVASDGEGADDLIAQAPATRRGDLLREKRAVLRAIKDAEFDRDMGKMSAEEAGEILRVYRARAIEIIRELDSGVDETGELSVDELIERELAARLERAGLATPADVTGAAEAADTAAPDKEPAPAPAEAAEAAALDKEPAPAPAEAAAPDKEPAPAPAEAGRKVCPACQADNESDAVFCKKCGGKLEAV
jgi:hypothetical protein